MEVGKGLVLQRLLIVQDVTTIAYASNPERVCEGLRFVVVGRAAEVRRFLAVLSRRRVVVPGLLTGTPRCVGVARSQVGFRSAAIF